MHTTWNLQIQPTFRLTSIHSELARIGQTCAWLAPGSSKATPPLWGLAVGGGDRRAPPMRPFGLSSQFALTIPGIEGLQAYRGQKHFLIVVSVGLQMSLDGPVIPLRSVAP